MDSPDSKTRTLAAESEEMASAIEVVLDHAEDHGTVNWSDVKDDISSGQWGRLIEKGVLVEGSGDGFVVDDPEGVREALETTEADADGDDDGSWTTWDKLAALGTLGLFAGYSINSIRDGIGGTVDILIGPLNELLPFYLVIIVIAIFNGATSSILQDNLMDMSGMGDHQAKMEEIKERRKKAKERDDEEALEEIEAEQMELMTDQIGMFKKQFRPMVWIMLINIPVFLWLYYMVFGGVLTEASPVVVMPVFGIVESWQQNLVGPMQSWIVWYFVCTLSFSQVIRKALNVQTTPTAN